MRLSGVPLPQAQSIGQTCWARQRASASSQAPSACKSGTQARPDLASDEAASGVTTTSSKAGRFCSARAIASAMDSHLLYTQRAMGEVLLQDQSPRDIWDQHEAILQAITEGQAEQAARLAHEHLMQASRFMVSRLKASNSYAPTV